MVLALDMLEILAPKIDEILTQRCTEYLPALLSLILSVLSRPLSHPQSVGRACCSAA